MKTINNVLHKINVNRIIKDLDALDPGVFMDRNSAIKTVEALLRLRPEVKLRPGFKSELKKKISDRIAQAAPENERSGMGAFLRDHARAFGISAAAFTSILAALTFSLNYDRIMHGPLQGLHTGSSEDSLVTQDLSGYIGGQRAEATEGTKSALKAGTAATNKNEAAATVQNGPGAPGQAEIALNEEYSSQERALPSVAPMSDAAAAPADDGFLSKAKKSDIAGARRSESDADAYAGGGDKFNTESYNLIVENDFLDPSVSPLSTFSIDVDTASYANMRRFVNGGSLPPKDAVHIEEMINYFSYNYPAPKGGEPFSVTTELGAAPWNPANRLLLVGLQGKRIAKAEKPASNLVFLIDTSGSMNAPEKLGLLKESFKLLTGRLGRNDRVSIVAYAGAAGVVLQPTPGDKAAEIIAALDRLESGGSTAGGEGIDLAYKVAEQNFNKKGNNRIIIATDGDFNIGASSDAEMVRLIEQKREKGIFISVLGFGMGNYKDSKMELIADKGNGNYFYIDTIFEAKKVMVSDMDSMMFTIAKDVKIQIEFNPAYVQSYRLIGYENRVMKAEDFDDDKKDAGEIGAGHTVTALYEITPRKEGNGSVAGNSLRYQQRNVNSGAYGSEELALIKLRFKKPDGVTSRLISAAVSANTDNAGENLQFASAVAEFGMLLRESQYKAKASYDEVIRRAERCKGEDASGYRGEFIQIVRKAKILKE